MLLRRPGRHRAAALRPQDRGDPARGLAALAGLGSGPDDPEYADALRGLRVVWIDAGVSGDEWFLDTGAKAVDTALRQAGVPAERIRSSSWVEATHMAIDYRYPMSLAWLCHRMS